MSGENAASEELIGMLVDEVADVRAAVAEGHAGRHHGRPELARVAVGRDTLNGLGVHRVLKCSACRGAPVMMPLYGAWTIRDGKVVRVTWFQDRDEALEAAGLSA